MTWKELKLKVFAYLDRPASVTADLIGSTLVGLGAALLIAILPFNWIPLVGPHLPGAAFGLVAMIYFYRARSNSPLNWEGKK